MGRWRTVDIIVALLAGLGLLNLLVGPLAMGYSLGTATSEAPDWPAIEEEQPWRPGSVLFVTAILLTLGAAAITLAHQAISGSRPLPALLWLAAAVLLALSFVGLQIHIHATAPLARQSFADATFWLLAGEHGFSTVFALMLLGVAIVLAVARAGQAPAPAIEAPLWFWHALDSAWLLILGLASWAPLLHE